MEYRGKLYIVGLPIGNMEDITLRAIKILKECQIVLAEDTREFKKIAKLHDIEAKIISYHNYNEHQNEHILEMIKEKKVALVSDRGMPLISDPGFLLVKECFEKCAHVIDIIPGVSAVTTAFCVSSFCNRFCFLGFLSQKDWKIIDKIPYSIIIFEAPHRINKTMQKLHNLLGERKVLVCREMTKIYQEIKLCSLGEEIIPKGEFTLVISPKFN